MKPVMLAAAVCAALSCACGPAVRVRSRDWQGSGPALIFLADRGEDEHVFDHLAPQFADRFHPMAVTSSGADLDALAGELRGLLDAQKIETAHFVGAGFGAAEVLELARLAPDRIDSMVLIDPVDPARPVDFSVVRKPALAIFAAGQPGEQGQLARRTAEAFAQQVPYGIVMFVQGPHRLHVEREADVVREMNAFYNSGLQQQP